MSYDETVNLESRNTILEAFDRAGVPASILRATIPKQTCITVSYVIGN